MKLTSKGRYAVMAMADLAKNNVKEPTSLTKISLRQGISIAYLEQLFLKLRRNNCSKKDSDIPCLNDISERLVGLLTLLLAISAIAITAYLPFDVSFITIHYLYLHEFTWFIYRFLLI